jgi:hypothetical protein
VFNIADPNVSYAYRYLRGVIPNYRCQSYKQQMPLAAFDMTDPANPRRVELGYLENMSATGIYTVYQDSMYWPPYNGDVTSNTLSTSAREHLFISDRTYSTTPSADMLQPASTVGLPYMYIASWNRRQAAGWSPGSTGEDQLDIFPTKPVWTADKFSWTGKADSVVTATRSLSLKDIKVVPNPFYAFSSFGSGTGQLIKFTYLPASCTIKIFTVAGDLIKIIYHNSSSNNDRITLVTTDSTYVAPGLATSVETWNLQTLKGRNIASGMYIALVEAPGIGKTTVKFAVIR